MSVRVFVSGEQVREVFESLDDSFDSACFDCGSNNVTGVSVPLAILLCYSCSERHKVRLKIDISFIKSILLDNWTVYSLIRVIVGGNRRAIDYFNTHNENLMSQENPLLKYQSSVAYDYKRIIDYKVHECLKVYPIDMQHIREYPWDAVLQWKFDDISYDKIEENTEQPRDDIFFNRYMSNRRNNQRRRHSILDVPDNRRKSEGSNSNRENVQPIIEIGRRKSTGGFQDFYYDLDQRLRNIYDRTSHLFNEQKKDDKTN